MVYIKEADGNEVKIVKSPYGSAFLENGVGQVDDAWGDELLKQGGFVKISKDEFEQARARGRKLKPERFDAGSFQKLPEAGSEDGGEK